MTKNNSIKHVRKLSFTADHGSASIIMSIIIKHIVDKDPDLLKYMKSWLTACQPRGISNLSFYSVKKAPATSLIKSLQQFIAISENYVEDKELNSLLNSNPIISIHLSIEFPSMLEQFNLLCDQIQIIINNYSTQDTTWNNVIAEAQDNFEGLINELSYLNLLESKEENTTPKTTEITITKSTTTSTTETLPNNIVVTLRNNIERLSQIKTKSKEEKKELNKHRAHLRYYMKTKPNNPS